MSYKIQELDSPQVFGGFHVAHLFSFVLWFLCFVCLGPVSCVPNVTIVSRLSLNFIHFKPWNYHMLIIVPLKMVI